MQLIGNNQFGSPNRTTKGCVLKVNTDIFFNRNSHRIIENIWAIHNINYKKKIIKRIVPILIILVGYRVKIKSTNSVAYTCIYLVIHSFVRVAISFIHKYSALWRRRDGTSKSPRKHFWPVHSLCLSYKTVHSHFKILLLCMSGFKGW